MNNDKNENNNDSNNNKLIKVIKEKCRVKKTLRGLPAVHK